MMNDTSKETSFVTNPESKRTGRRQRRRSIIHEFCLNTSTHALPGIARSETLHNRVFWLISFLIFTGIMIYFVVKSIMAFFDYPTTIDLTYDSDWQQYFAAFSFCNMAPFRLDLMIEPLSNYANSLDLTNTNDTQYVYQSSFIWDFIADKLNKNESLEDYFFPLSSMVHFCLYNLKSCSLDDFISFVSPVYGQCYTFNAKLKNSTDNSLRSGNFYGGAGILTLGLYIHSYQYLSLLTDAAGILALVHDNRQVPTIETSGVELGPGRRHKISYRRKKTTFLSSPYSDCTNEISNSLNAILKNYDPADYNYSQTICFQVCQQIFVYDECGCINPYAWNIRSIVRPGTDKINLVPVCNISDSCYETASDKLFASAKFFQNYCSDCSQECLINNFVVQTSSSMSSFDSIIYSIKNFVENSTVLLPDDWSTSWRQYIDENYLMVNVIRETHVVEINTQTSSVSLVDVLSNIGGHAGLWIGISFLSIMELIEMIFRLFRYQWYLIRETMQRRINVI
ncbi:unnamed protein product [Rotaria sp. Silwood2]|nr:unnamed protein product [Rotaria sp. Silwood2]